MAATIEEIIADIAQRLELQYEEALTGTYVKSASAGITTEQWDTIAVWLQNRDFEAIGKFVAQRVKAAIEQDAISEAAVMTQDGLLTLADYDRIQNLS